jgi:glucose/arabinose dehydrogenase
MRHNLFRRAASAAAAISLALLGSCGGGGGGGDGSSPVPTITSPAEGATFRAGDTLAFAGSATDPQDGTLGGSSLTWWAELHHDTHTHPAQPMTTGASGTFTVPTRGETSHNIWYRFHLRATDSNGQQAEVTRDVMPLKSQITLATVPAGLQLTLEGAPVSGPHPFTSVVGLQRDLGASTQVFNGRRYTFSGWSHGGAARQTIATPAADTTYTANFVDSGPSADLGVTLSAPATASVGSAVTLTASVVGSAVRVEFFDFTTLIGTDSSSPYSLAWTPDTSGDHSLTARAVDAAGASTTSFVVNVAVSGAGTPSATLTAPANLASGLTGTLTLRADASDDTGVAAVEFQIDGLSLGEDTSAPYEASVDTAVHTSGQHVLRARSRDGAGNRSPWSSAKVEFGGSVEVPQGFTKADNWVVGLTDATAFAQASDGRFFVAEQGGALRVVRNAALLATAFRQFTVDPVGERGLLGVALHPNFASNGWVYVYYTTPENGAHNRISRLVANGDVSDGSETVLVNLPALSVATNHNGGALHFGPDGKLYVAVGENAEAAKAQDLNDPFGKILRFNDDGTIPGDNPFCTASELRCAVWAYGLRNPFTFAFQPGTGRMHINDVGGSTWEEINVGAAGANYGWPGSEGPDRVSGNIIGPIFAYGHPPPQPSNIGGFFSGFAIAGGAFYPSTGPFPDGYRGSYFFGEFGSDYVGRLDIANGNAAYMFARLTDHAVDLLVGTDGALYVLARGRITRISAP